MSGLPGPRRQLATVMLAIAAGGAPLHTNGPGPPSQASGAVQSRTMTYAEARPVIPLLKTGLPSGLSAEPVADGAPSFEAWVAQHRARQQERLTRGDEDSIVNYWLFGTSFTRLPPARERDLAADPTRARTDIANQRLEDLLIATRSLSRDERLAFVRETLGRWGIDPTTRFGAQAARERLQRARDRAVAEFAQTDRALRAARRGGTPAAELETHSTIFRDRGLSSDTSLLVNYALDRALAALAAGGILPPGSVRRIAIVGPGLDFINKADGQDFYPQQSIQPFAVADSLFRLGLAQPGGLELTAFDLNARVTHHLSSARARSVAGTSYLLHLPLPSGERWTPELRDYWKHLGASIGSAVRPSPLPDTVAADIRAVEVAASVLQAIVPRQLDIVVERLELGEDQRFDLVIGTNVFVYYSPFEQGLAASNIAAMLRSGGVLLSNNDVPALPPMKPAVGFLPITYSDRQNDSVFSYQRQ